MAVSPIKIYNKIIEAASEYSDDLLNSPVANRKALGVMSAHEKEIIPYDAAETIFEQHGYGPNKAMKWINHWVAKGWLGLSPAGAGSEIFIMVADSYIRKEKAVAALGRRQ